MVYRSGVIASHRWWAICRRSHSTWVLSKIGGTQNYSDQLSDLKNTKLAESDSARVQAGGGPGGRAFASCPGAQTGRAGVLVGVAEGTSTGTL